MKLYKYKSLQNFEHFADIILNKRFYAAQFFELNDPMEGVFNFEHGTKEEYLKQIKEGKKKLLICSFAQEPDNVLLWSHYANGCRGVCIEVEINDDARRDYEVAHINYVRDRITFSNEEARLIEEVPKILLNKKNIKWKYEKEVRVLSHEKYVYGLKITGILLGIKISETIKKVILKMPEQNIPIWETRIGDTNKIEIGQQINRVDQIQP